MMPADQRFVADGPVVGEARLRLVMELEATLGQSASEIAREIALLAQLEIHAGFEEAGAAVGNVDGAMQSEVRMSHELGRRPGIVREQRYPGARPDFDLTALDRH